MQAVWPLDFHTMNSLITCLQIFISSRIMVLNSFAAILTADGGGEGGGGTLKTLSLA